MFGACSVARCGVFHYRMHDGNMQIAKGVADPSLPIGKQHVAGLFSSIQPKGFYAGAASCVSGAARVAEAQLSKDRSVPARCSRLAAGNWNAASTRSQHTVAGIWRVAEKAEGRPRAGPSGRDGAKRPERGDESHTADHGRHLLRAATSQHRRRVRRSSTCHRMRIANVLWPCNGRLFPKWPLGVCERTVRNSFLSG